MTNSIVFDDERVENEYDRIYTVNNYPELFNEYDTGYINDNIWQIADDCTSVYYSDCVKYAMQNPDYMGRVIEECLIDTKCYDFYHHCSLACYLANSDEMYEMYDDLIKFKMLAYCRENGIQITCLQIK